MNLTRRMHRRRRVERRFLEKQPGYEALETLFAGLSKRIDLKLVSRLEFGSGAVRCG